MFDEIEQARDEKKLKSTSPAPQPSHFERQGQGTPMSTVSTNQPHAPSSVSTMSGAIPQSQILKKPLTASTAQTQATTTTSSRAGDKNVFQPPQVQSITVPARNPQEFKREGSAEGKMQVIGGYTPANGSNLFGIRSSSNDSKPVYSPSGQNYAGEQPQQPVNSPKKPPIQIQVSPTNGITASSSSNRKIGAGIGLGPLLKESARLKPENIIPSSPPSKQKGTPVLIQQSPQALPSSTSNSKKKPFNFLGLKFLSTTKHSQPN